MVPFPARERQVADIELVHGHAPSRSLVDSLLAEAGIPAHDAAHGVARELAYQAVTFERGYGRDAAVARFRQAVDGLTTHAAALCRDHRKAMERLVSLEMGLANKEPPAPGAWLRLQNARAALQGQAIAARVASDAAIGAASALTAYILQDGAVGEAAEPRQLALFATGT